MKTLLIVIAVTCFAITCPAQVPLEKNVSLDPATFRIDVYLPPKSVTGWNEIANWTVVALDKSNNVQKVDMTSIEADKDNSMFSLMPVDTSINSLIRAAAQLIIKFGPKSVTVYQVPKSDSTTGGTASVGPAQNKQNADLYFSASYSPAIHSAPQYSIDGSIGMVWDLDHQHVTRGQLGFLGTVKTDKRKKVDPDSYRIFLVYQNTLVNKFHGPMQGVRFTWLAAGGEFDRKGKTVSFISAPSLDFPLRLFPRIIHSTKEAMAVLTPTAGFEVGHNFHNAVTPNVGRAVARGVVGASLLYRFNPKLPGFKGVELSSSYMLRMPLAREVFTLTKTVNGQDVDAPFLGKNPRHYLKTELGLKLTDTFALSFKHEYGAVPPVFRKADHKVTVGFTFSIRQLNGGVPSALRNK